MNRLPAPGRSYRLAVAAALALVLLRGIAWVWFAPSGLDGDEAITGLMARHLSEGRAFPLFFYGQPYLLALESWVAAPAFMIFGASAYTLRAVVLGLNLLAAWLLVRELVVCCGLSSWVAVAASGFVLVPTPRASALLGQAVGMNVEPFVAALLLWALRRRPLWFGAVFAVAFLNREFAIYALVALVITWGAGATAGGGGRRAEGGGNPPPVSHLESVLLAAAAFAGVWDAVQLLRHFASPLGPGTSAMPGAAATNVGRVAGFVGFSPATLLSDLWAMASRFLPELFGARQEVLPPLVALHTWQAHQFAWLLLVLALGGPFLLAVVRLSRARARLSSPAVRFALYLTLIGAQAAIVCAVTRGPGMSVYMERYILLALFLGVGTVTLAAAVQPRGVAAGVAIAAAAAWMGLASLDNARLVAACIRQPPPAPRLELTRALEARGVRYAEANYWLAYPVSFLSEERVKVASTDVVRVEEYRWLFTGHPEDAKVVQFERCQGCERVAGAWMRAARR